MALLYKIFKGAFVAAVILLFIGVSQVFAADTWEWTAPTPGEVNVRMSMKEIQVPLHTLIISELLPYPESGEEYVKVYNYGGEVIALNGYTLEDATGKKFTFDVGDVVDAKGTITITPTFALNNTSDEEVILKDPTGEVVDTWEFTGDDIEKGKALMKTCEVYELRFCEVHLIDPNSAGEGTLPELEVWSEPEGGPVDVLAPITLHSNYDDAKILYSFFPDVADTASQRTYTGPIRLQHSATLYFFAYVDGKASKIGQASFIVPETRQYHLDYGVSINEVMVDPYDGEASQWVEIGNFSDQSVDIGGFVLSPDQKGESCMEMRCFFLPESYVVAPGEFKVLYNNKEKGNQVVWDYSDQEIYLLDRNLNIVDDVRVGDRFSIGGSFARSYYLDTSLSPNRNLQKYRNSMVFVWTHFPTPGEENMIHVVYEDSDNDTLPSADEVTYGMDPDLFDTDLDGLPDIYEVNVTDQDTELYRRTLGALQTVQVLYKDPGTLLTGRAMPESVLTLFNAADEAVADIQVSSSGDFLWTLAEDILGSAYYYTKQRDILGTVGTSSPRFEIVLNEESSSQLLAASVQGQLKIIQVFPNPIGKDTRDTEWLVIKNEGQENIRLSDYNISINGRTAHELPQVTLYPEETHLIYAEAISETLPNKEGSIVLTDTNGVEMHTVQYKDAKEGDVIDFEVQGGTVYFASSTDPVYLEEEQDKEVRILDHIPTVDEVAVENTATLALTTSGNIVRKEPKTIQEMTMSETFLSAQPQQDRKNFILSLLGSVVAFVSGFIFWKF